LAILNRKESAEETTGYTDWRYGFEELTKRTWPRGTLLGGKKYAMGRLRTLAERAPKTSERDT